MTTTCSFSHKEVGPFPQTLFLGCSLINMGHNLAWGSEPSTCMIKLVKDLSSHPSDGGFASVTTNINTILNNNSIPSTLFNGENLEGTDTGKTLQKNIAKQEQNTENNRISKDNDSSISAKLNDQGKKCWDVHRPSDNPINWVGPDPGFIGDNWFVGGRLFGVAGVPCQVRFDDVIFNGFINKWTYDAGTYSVELHGPGSLLKGTQLILNGYYGSISTILESTQGALPNRSSLAVPYLDTSIEDASNGSIYRGNIPNTINIFGFLQNTFGFGSAITTSDGINAAQIYDALVLLLCNPNELQKNKFSPYGAIVGKSLIEYTQGNNVSIVAPQDQTISYRGVDLDFTNLGLFNHKLAADSIYRPLFRLDLTNVPRPDPNIYLTLTNNMSLDDFITFCCDGAGADWNTELVPDVADSPYSGRLLINVYNRNIQPRPKMLKDLITNFGPNDRVVSYSIGEEYSDEKVRKVIVGGKQERIFQVMSHTLSKFRNHRIFDPATGNFTVVDPTMNSNNQETGSNNNTVRFPKRSSTRAYDSSINPIPYRQYGGAATAQEDNDFLTAQLLGFSNVNVTKGSYDTSTPKLKTASAPRFMSPPWFSGDTSYPLYYDLISPYFGRGTDGSVRRVFYDRKMRQIQVNVNLQDIQPFFPVYDGGTFSGFVTFYENEIRAAISGFDSWISYVLEPVKLGFRTPTTRLIYSFISLKYGTTIANQLMLGGLGLLKTDSKMSALPVPPHTGDKVSVGSFAVYKQGIYSALEKLHQFISSNLGSHYGKDFLVRIPNILRRVDANGLAHYSYEICESGWEEEGNFLDDTMQIGSPEATALAEENGKFGPILGYNASAEYDNTLYHNLNSTNFGMMPLSTQGKTLLQMRSQFETVNGGANKWYYPLVHDISPEDVVLMPHKSYFLPEGNVLRGGLNIGNPSLTDSFNNTIPDGKKYKMYIKGQILDVVPENRTNTKILFANNAQYCVVSAPNKIYYRSNNSLVKTLFDDLYTVAVKSFELPVEFNNSYQINIPSISVNYLLFMSAMLDNVINSSAFPVSIGLNSEDHVPISPRCAMPCFAAIPIKDNLSTYGPWSSHPSFVGNAIFPNISNDGVIALVNNIVGGVDIEISDSYVPWEYGSMDHLDSAVLSQLASNNKYQQVLEAGSITLAGILLRNANIGRKFIDDFGPVCNSIQIDIGTDGFKTTYHFRTYSRKLGYFNREQAENIKRFGQQALSNRKQIVSTIRSQLNRQAQLQDPSTDRAARLPKALAYSPVNVLVGGSYPMVHQNSILNNAYTQLKFSPEWHLRPRLPPTVPVNPKDMLRQQTVTQLYDPQELGEVIGGRPADYGSKAIMSLDGILSPISFYPTHYGSTYAITFYPRTKCPYCKGTGKYNYQSYRNTSVDMGSTSTTNTNTIMSSLQTTENTACIFCVPDTDISELKKKSARPNEITPPFLIASGTDSKIISDRNTAFQYNSCIINGYTLNPMIMSATGSDFSCYMNKQSSDRCGHSIDVVSFGNVVPDFNDGLRASLSPTINKNYNDYDINLISADASRTDAFQNVRFFGLRGPLMLHSWGYDLEGYPVPNSSGEFKFDAQGDVILFNEKPVFKNQVLQSDGTYSAPYKDNTFYKGWGQLPSTWPVGPIDLRWDEAAKVWTIGANYKPVWVVLETDLLNKDPVRGTIVESSYDNSPLPSGLRKLVFVRDTAGMFSAPRGAALYCRYDSQNGFYEPVYNRPLVTTGTIDGANLVTIYKAYTPSIISEDVVSTYATTFDNPLNFDANMGDIGLFIFLNGKWILQSIRN